MTSVNPSAVLSKYNENIYVESIKVFQDFIIVFTFMEVGYEKIWKPCQKGVLISTQSMLELQTYLLDQKSFEYKLKQIDFLKKLFSVLRSKQVLPNAVQMKNSFKAFKDNKHGL